MAEIEHLLAVVAVSDLATSTTWYATLFGREPDNNPMPTLVEWQVTAGGWVQVTEDPERAGRSLLNLAVTDLDAAARRLRDVQVEVGDVIEANKGVRLCPVQDPDGNQIHLIGGFRVHY